VIQLVSAVDGQPGVFAVGQQATGFIAVGQFATGFIAIGQVATGVIAVGQLARGGLAVGQLAFGLFAVGMLGIGVLWCAGLLGLAGMTGPGLLMFRALGWLRLRQWRLRAAALVRGQPWDTVGGPPAWRRALGLVVLAGIVVAWVFLAAGPVVAGLS
jgi:hypothetical protein